MNDILTTEAVLNYTLPEFTTYCLFLHTGNRDAELEWENAEYKFGQNVDIRRQNRSYIQDGPTGVADLQFINEEFETFTIDHWYKKRFSFDVRDLTLEVDRFYERYVKNTVRTMATLFDTDAAVAAKYRLNYFVGTPGTPLNSYKVLADVNAKMNELGLEHEMERYLAVTPIDAANLRAQFFDSFNSVLNSNIVQHGKLGRIDALDIVQSTGLGKHIAGTPGAGPITVSVTTGSGTNIPMTGFDINTLVVRRGDVFSIAGVKAINPLRNKETSFDMQFIATADVTSDGFGNATIPVLAAGAPIISGAMDPNRNVSNAIQSGSVVTFIGDHNVNIAYVPAALSLASPMLAPLRGIDSSVVPLPEMNVSMRMSCFGDVVNGQNSWRIEMLGGIQWHPQYAIRVIS